MTTRSEIITNIVVFPQAISSKIFTDIGSALLGRMTLSLSDDKKIADSVDVVVAAVTTFYYFFQKRVLWLIK